MSVDLCSVQGGNTGRTNCDITFGRPVKPIIGGKSFTSSEYADAATFQAALIAATKLENDNASKLVAFPKIGKIDPTTPASTSGNLPFGSVKQLIKGIPSYLYTVEVTYGEYQKILAYHKKQVPVLTLDDQGAIWGYRAAAKANTLNTKNFSGQIAYVTVEGLGFNDGSSVETGLCKIGVNYLDVDDFEKRSAYILQPDLSASDLVGLKDVTLNEPSAHVSNVFKIKMSIATPKLGGDLNIYDDFAALIQPLTWTAFSGVNFATSMPVTSIALDAANKCLTVTLDTTLFTALSAGSLVKLVAPLPAVLDAAGVTGIELGYIILTK